MIIVARIARIGLRPTTVGDEDATLGADDGDLQAEMSLEEGDGHPMAHKRIVTVEDGEPRVVALFYLVVGAFEMPLTALVLVAMVENRIVGGDPATLFKDISGPVAELVGHDGETALIPRDTSYYRGAT
jgi:hypothetical protein